MSDQKVPEQEVIDESISKIEQEVPSLNPPADTAPYEAPLLKAFEKLSSQVLIFLLAYVILLIGVAVFGSELSETLRNLLYIIPILGVGAYLWTQRSGARKVAKKYDLDVDSWFAFGSSEVKGVKGAMAISDIPETLRTKSFIASGNAEVIGIEYASSTDQDETISESYLIEIFRRLDEDDQGKVIDRARNLERKQE